MELSRQSKYYLKIAKIVNKLDYVTGEQYMSLSAALKTIKKRYPFFRERCNDLERRLDLIYYRNVESGCIQ